MRKELEVYEVLFLIDPNLNEKELSTVIENYQKFLTKKGSKVMVQNQGRRTLSYAVKKFETAYFVQMVFIGNGSLLADLSVLAVRDELVLRHIPTKLDDILFADVASSGSTLN